MIQVSTLMSAIERQHGFVLTPLIAILMAIQFKCIQIEAKSKDNILTCFLFGNTQLGILVQTNNLSNHMAFTLFIVNSNTQT